VISFPGYQRVYVEGRDDGAEAEEAERRLPALDEGDALDIAELVPQGHETSPPARFTEASLVKRLAELEVGRPSTYAATIERIQNVGYVWKKGSALVPSFTAFAVVTLLERHFPDLVDYAYTPRMEDDLDDIAGGTTEPVPWLTRFYFGDGDAQGLKRMVTENIGDIDAIEVSTIPIGVDADGTPVEARVGRYGPYLVRGEERANIPEDVVPDELTIERAIALLEAPSGDRLARGRSRQRARGHRQGRPATGPYVQLGEIEDGSKDKPPTASLFKTMTLDTVTLEDALRLLTLPRVVGVDPADGQEITAQNGRYGPYIKKGTDSRTIESEELLLTITLDEAQKVFAEPKRPAGPGGHAAPEGARGRRRLRQADRVEGGPLRPLRDRRRDQRVAPQGRHGGGHHARAGDRAPAGPEGQGPGSEEAAEAPQGAGRQEGGDGQEGSGQEDRRQEGAGLRDCVGRRRRFGQQAVGQQAVGPAGGRAARGGRARWWVSLRWRGIRRGKS
jgi:DNA topoisomerase-1